MQAPTPVFVVNLAKRKDRKQHILQEFEGRKCFSVSIIEAQINTVGAVGLWDTIQSILRRGIELDHDYIILCEDDHQFTGEFTSLKFAEDIEEAKSMDADILLGGVSWFQGSMQVSERLYWVHRFTGLQFTVIFRKFFSKILCDASYSETPVDLRISALTKKKYVIFPYISTQKDFGYSDATTGNNNNISVGKLFSNSADCIQSLNKVKEFYARRNTSSDYSDDEVYGLPTFVINGNNPIVARNCLRQFEHKNEFNIQIDRKALKIGEPANQCNSTFWETLLNAIIIAKDNDDDFVIIIQDDGEFSQDYNKSYLLDCIVSADDLGIEILSSETIGFRHIVPVSRNLYWFDSMLYAPFLILYSSVFQRIIDFTFLDYMNPYTALAELTSSKATIYPSLFHKRSFDFEYVTVPFNKDTRYEKLASRYNAYLEDIRDVQSHLKTYQNASLNDSI